MRRRPKRRPRKPKAAGKEAARVTSPHVTHINPHNTKASKAAGNLTSHSSTGTLLDLPLGPGARNGNTDASKFSRKRNRSCREREESRQELYGISYQMLQQGTFNGALTETSKSLCDMSQSFVSADNFPMLYGLRQRSPSR